MGREGKPIVAAQTLFAGALLSNAHSPPKLWQNRLASLCAPSYLPLVAPFHGRCRALDCSLPQLLSDHNLLSEHNYYY